ncbi:MAG: hypothetical protein MI784_09335 [Cytophagales bacterium]|nr:hypothetical protein [Cytophagales bacterium]
MKTASSGFSFQKEDSNSHLHSPAAFPEISLPRGGGALQGIEDKFQVQAATGTSSLEISLPLSASRKDFVPELSLSYNSGSGNSAFGLGWNIEQPSVSRKTHQELPKYQDETESDTFILSGLEDLVPKKKEKSGNWVKKTSARIFEGANYKVAEYRPRVERAHLRIERWVRESDGDTYWKTVSPDNVHTYYGLTESSRISDPEDPKKIFEWKICRQYDDQGSLTVYEYKKEDFEGVPFSAAEKNKIGRSTQLYLKKVCYGVRTPYYTGDAVPDSDGFLFQLVLDYGEHATDGEPPKDVHLESSTWNVRQDPFSSFRSGFEIRSYRRCRRLLMFHCFDTPDLPHKPYLAKSLDLFYNEEQPFSLLEKAQNQGYQWDEGQNRYRRKSVPPFQLNYQQPAWNASAVKISPESAMHAPEGIKDYRYMWVDLFSEGIAGILTEKQGCWHYKSNLGEGEFSPASPVSQRPSFRGLNYGRTALMDLEASGEKTLVQLDRRPQGFFKLDAEDNWEVFRTFESIPNIDWKSGRLHTLDLNGNGKSDLLLSEDNCLRWYSSLGDKGFSVSQKIVQAIDEEQGPALLFNDESQSVFFADMSGDGLSDILRVRNGETVYWPNLGYGRFGAKVAMENAPLFDAAENFNLRNLRLADIDGSGATDLIYLGKKDFRVWINQSGNAWAPSPQILESLPVVDNLSDVAVLDFLGTGTGCVVFSSPLPHHKGKPVIYVDLMDSRKPYLLTGYSNNMGKKISIEYKSSAHFYLQDKIEGHPWITKLPFPVHCVWKISMKDHVRKTVFSSSYRYSHGYYDPSEREYRGFARVEQLDTEEFSQHRLNDAKNVVEETLYQPPVRTVSWFHTGALLRNEKILHQLQKEYFDNSFFAEHNLKPLLLAESMSAEEKSEALRAFKGMLLRTEVYAEDGTEKSGFPYAVGMLNASVQKLQPKAGSKHASFQVLPAESIQYVYDRNPEDPRISHSFTLETDQLGNVTQSASVVYPRASRPTGDQAVPDSVWEEQNKQHILYGETDFSQDILEEDCYRLRVPCENRVYELSGLAPSGGFYFQLNELKTEISKAAAIQYEEEFTSGVQKRLSSHQRIYFWNDSLSAVLPLGELSHLGIPCQQNRLAFTKNMIPLHYGSKLDDASMQAAGYVHSEGDEHWWTQGGKTLFAAQPKDNFYLPVGSEDVYGNASTLQHDSYHFFILSFTNALGHTASRSVDYRTLSTEKSLDLNGNRIEAERDELGVVTKTALTGKEGEDEGDSLEDPTARLEYDLFNWMDRGSPNFIHTFTREKHGADNPRWQETYLYADGSGSELMVKSQAEPGEALVWNTDTQQTDKVHTNARWIGNGRTILNNKGNPVKSFEPYFSTTHEFEEEDALVETGHSALSCYDPVGRPFRTDFPNGTFGKSVFDPWTVKSYDANDTVIDSQWYTDRNSPDPLGAEPANQEERAAWLTAHHAETPAAVFLDSLGRACSTLADYGSGKTTHTSGKSGLTGRHNKAYDQKDRMASEEHLNLLGVTMRGWTAEKGEQWAFLDVMGRPVKMWDNDRYEFRITFDEIHRPVSTYMKEGRHEVLLNHLVYGDILANAEERNLKGVPFMIFDQSGAVTVDAMDFKGNPTSAKRQLCKDYKQLIDWSALEGLDTEQAIAQAAAPILEDEVFESSAILDALNRPSLIVLPDGSEIESAYNESNTLKSLRVKIGGQGDFQNFLNSQSYNAKGQRESVNYNNGLITNYFYDPKTFRLTELLTKASGAPDSQAIQHLHYTFDPVGNIVHQKDDARQTHFFSNAVVKAERFYEYDAVYQLIKATGREHAGLAGNAQRNHSDLPFASPLPHANDTHAMASYTESYQYDDCGNILQMKHQTSGGNWTRKYRYAYQANALDATNRLTASSQPGDPVSGPYSDEYAYDAHGNMTSMPHLQEMVWNFMDQLREADLGGGGKMYCTYGTGGVRARKVTERIGGQRQERIYLGALEIFREYQGNDLKLERSTLHVSDNAGKFAQIDTKTLDTDNSDPDNPLNRPLIRYQYGDHLGSSVLETDHHGNVISYEEFHPFGTSACRIGTSGASLSLKRYRFCGKELDDETGLYSMGARYYAPWLGRWTSSDPAGFVSGFNLYRYCRNNPVNYHDPNGMEETVHANVSVPEHLQTHVFKDSNDARNALNSYFLGRTFTVDGMTFMYRPNSMYWKDGRNRGRMDRIDSGGSGNSPAPPATPSPDPSPDPDAGSAPQAEDPGDSGGSAGAGAVTHAGPAAERFIWNYKWKGGLNGASQRGFILQNLYTNNLNIMERDSVPRFDNETPTNVQQIKSMKASSAAYTRRVTSGATKAAGEAVTGNLSGTMTGKRPQAVIITETDAPAWVGDEIQEGYDRMRRPPANSVDPEHVRGLPGRVGMATRGLTVLGTGASVWGLWNDIQRGDVAMGVGDTLGVAGGGLEIYAIASPGATVAGVSAMSAGLIVGGLGISVTSGISSVRSFRRGDTAGGVAGLVGVGAGVAITAGAGIMAASAAGVAVGAFATAAAPLLLAFGVVAALGVGAFHLGRYFDWW